MNPPLREQADVDALRVALADGTIDAIATDHAPHAPETKDVPFEEAPPGMLGVETALAVVLTTLVEPGVLHARPGARARCRGSRRAIAGLDERGHGGPIAAGRPAHLCVIDPAHQWVVDGNALASRVAQHAVGGLEAHRQGPPHDLRRSPDRARRRGDPMSRGRRR